MTIIKGANHVLHYKKQKETSIQKGVNLEIFIIYGLFSATRKHEVGIVSNHLS